MGKEAARCADQQNHAMFADQPANLSRAQSREQYSKHMSENLSNDQPNKDNVCGSPITIFQFLVKLTYSIFQARF